MVVMKMLNIVCNVSGAGNARGRKFALCGVFVQETETSTVSSWGAAALRRHQFMASAQPATVVHRSAESGRKRLQCEWDLVYWFI
jgi:hypothetical protein